MFTDFGNTPGHYACESGKPECFSCYLFHGGEIDIQNIRGDTPLDAAKKAGHPLLMEKAGITKIAVYSYKIILFGEILTKFLLQNCVTVYNALRKFLIAND